MDLPMALQKNELFAHLPDGVIRRELLPHGYLQTFQKGQVVISPQQKVDRLGVILTGRIHIMHLFSKKYIQPRAPCCPARFSVIAAPLRLKTFPYHIRKTIMCCIPVFFLQSLNKLNGFLF